MPPPHAPLLRRIDAHLDWGPSDTWANAHFERLAVEIGEVTDVHLSATTLKRVWGRVAYKSNPSPTTLDALARFGGFEDWVTAQAHLASSARGPAAVAPDADAALPEAVSAERSEPRLRPALLGLGAALLGVVLVAAVAQRFAEPYAGPPPAAVRFDIAPVAEGLPNTVQFRYAIAGAFDSVQIQQSWDARLRHRVDPSRDFYACTYYYPGAYQAKLLADTHVVAERPLVVPSGGYLGTVGARAQATPPAYVRGAELELADGVYRISPDSTLSADHEAAISYIVPSPGLSDADAFTLRTRFRSLGEDVCHRSRLIIFGEAGVVVLPFALPGCTGELSAFAGGERYRGSEVDLAGFGVSRTEVVDVEVALRDSVLAVWVRGAGGLAAKPATPAGAHRRGAVGVARGG